MAGINYPRVLLGGLVAGVVLASGEAVLDTFVLAEEIAAATPQDEAPAMSLWTSAALAGTVACYGIVLVWLYAAMRPRFGAGPRTAMIAGLTLWLIAWALLGVALTLTGAVAPQLAGISAIWGVFELPIAAWRGRGCIAKIVRGHRRCQSQTPGQTLCPHRCCPCSVSDCSCSPVALKSFPTSKR